MADGACMAGAAAGSDSGRGVKDGYGINGVTTPPERAAPRPPSFPPQARAPDYLRPTSVPAFLVSRIPGSMRMPRAVRFVVPTRKSGLCCMGMAPTLRYS